MRGQKKDLDLDWNEGFKSCEEDWENEEGFEIEDDWRAEREGWEH